MPTVAENLVTVKENLVAILLEITTNPKPTYSLDGQSVSWESYLAMLLQRLEDLDKAIQRAGSPFGIMHRGRF